VCLATVKARSEFIELTRTGDVLVVQGHDDITLAQPCPGRRTFDALDDDSVTDSQLRLTLLR